MNIYLDIDGVLITKEKQKVLHLHSFLKWVISHNCYWLTTHCKGDSSTALKVMVDKVSKEEYDLLLRIKPSNWTTWKTEAIDFSKPFKWFDDSIFTAEKKVLESHNSLDSFIKVDLINNPNQLEIYGNNF